MKKACLAVMLVLLVSMPALAQERAGDEVRELQRSLRELREEISRLHMVNSLELTLEQALELKMLLDDLKLARELFTEQTAGNQKEMVAALQKIRDALAAGAQEIQEELLAEYNKLRKKNGEAAREFFEKLKKADEELNTILTPGQREAVENYDADPLRPKGEGGKSESSRLERMAKLLDRIVALNPEQLAQAGEKLMQQFLGKLTKARNVAPQYMQKVRRKVEEVIQKARAVDEFEYVLWREELARQLLELTNPPKRRGRQVDKRQKGPKLSKAGTVLLDEGMLSALEAKIKALRKAEEEEKPAEPGSDKRGEE